MACTDRGNRELMMKSKKAAQTAEKPIDKLRHACLARGANGIQGLARTFKIMDDDSGRSLDIKEFKKGVRDYGCMMEDADIESLFRDLDSDQSGKVDFDEFLLALRPPMSQSRLELIQKAYRKLDKNADGFITVADLKGVYNVKKNPKYLSGELTEDQILDEFLDRFEVGSKQKDHKVTEDEFRHYYFGVSASIDNDAYFDLMMRQAWHL